MRGLIKELWHRHLHRKPWVFRDRFGLRYLFTPQDDVADYCARGVVIDNPAFLAYLQTTLTEGQTFVDLSPAVGGVALLAAQKVKVAGAVYAFAPAPSLYRQLVNNVALNGLTQTVRVIGRSVVEAPAAPASTTLDQFAAEWNWPAVDHLRLRDTTRLAALLVSANALFQAGRIRQVLLDEVPEGAAAEAAALLGRSGFTVQTLAADGKLQPLGTRAPAAKLNLIATRRPEAGHA